MFQLTVYHNTDLEDSTIEEFIEFAQENGLTVISQEWDDLTEETIVVFQGTKDQFFCWNDYLMEGGPSWSEEEFMEELQEVQVA